MIKKIQLRVAGQKKVFTLPVESGTTLQDLLNTADLPKAYEVIDAETKEALTRGVDLEPVVGDGQRFHAVSPMVAGFGN